MFNFSYKRWADVSSPQSVLPENSLQYIPIDYMSDETCMSAIKKNGLDIEYVPERLRTRELCCEAVKQSGEAIKFLNQDLELCDLAVNQNGLALEHVKDAYKTEKICKAAVRNNPLALKWADQTENICLVAVQLNPKTIEYVEDVYKTDKVCEAVVTSPFSGAGEYLPDGFKNKFDEFYKTRGFDSFGPIKICTAQCLYTYPCKHWVVLEDGSVDVLPAPEIGKLLHKHNVSHPHFREWIH